MNLSASSNRLENKKTYMKKILENEVEKIVKPIPTTDVFNKLLVRFPLFPS